MNVVSCYPKQDSKTPAQNHITACSRNCADQLALSGAEWVLVVGGTALRVLFPWHLCGINRVEKFRTITQMRGIPWAYRDKKWMACVHPAAGLRQEKYMELFRRDIFRFVTMVREGAQWDDRCFVCSEEVERYNEIGIPFCLKHKP